MYPIRSFHNVLITDVEVYILNTFCEYLWRLADTLSAKTKPRRNTMDCIKALVENRGQTTVVSLSAMDRVDYIIPEKTVPHRQRRRRHLSNYGHQMSAITHPSLPFLLSLLWVTDRPRFLFPPTRGV